MLTPDNREIDRTTPPDGVTIGQLVALLESHKHLPLVFAYGGRTSRPGYHVTEVKAGEFSALDCGANPESWSEIFVQLWDVEEGDRMHMPSRKFSAIVRKVAEKLSLDMDARLTFEVSDGLGAMQLHKALVPIAADDAVLVELAPRAASCKPRDRWPAEHVEPQPSCCGSPAQGSRCCA